MRVSMQHREQLFQSNLPFSNDHKVRPSVEVLFDVCAWLRAADDRLPTGIFSAAQNFNHVRTRHQVCVYAQHRWRALLNDIEQLPARGKRGIEDLNLRT